MHRQASAIRFAVRPRVLLHGLGAAFVAVGGLLAVPAAVAAGLGDWALAGRAASGAGLLLVLGPLLARIPGAERIQRNEALCLGALAFLAASAAMAWPLSAAGLSPVDAFFESVSGVTTTGLTVVEGLDGAPASFLFARAWMQWFGGLGIVVVTLAVLVHPGAAAKELGRSEVDHTDFLGSTRSFARRVLVLYGAITLLGVAGVLLLGAAPFEGLLYVLASVSTGGFAPSDESLAAIGGWPLRVLAMALAVLGATPFVYFLALRRRGWRHAARAPEPLVVVAAGLAAALVIGAFLRIERGADWDLAARHGLLLGFSAQTTTGFTTIDVGDLDPGANLAIVLSMIVGGGAGSTAGGIKILRLLVLLKMAAAFVARTGLPPHGVYHPRLRGRRIGDAEIQEAIFVTLGFLSVVFLSWLAFVAYGHDPLDALFDVASAAGTVGLSTGVVSSDLPLPLKLVLCADMLLGRLEFLALLVLFAPNTWFGRRKPS